MNEPATPPGRVFEVRYGPEKPRRINEPWPNNLDLAGSGQVIVTPDSVTFTDGSQPRKPARRVFAMGDIANIGTAPDHGVIVIRTRNDDREVYIWDGLDDRRALLGLLPKVTTLEFIEREKQHQEFRENLQALAPRPWVTPTIVGINVLVFAIMPAFGASGWWDPERMSAGASGAVFGIYGALLAFFARRPRDIPVDMLKSVGMGAVSLLLYSLAFGFALDFVPNAPRVDNSAHLGGLLAGAISGYLLARPFEPAARAAARPWQVAAVAAGICGALVLLASFIKV